MDPLLHTFIAASLLALFFYSGKYVGHIKGSVTGSMDTLIALYNHNIITKENLDQYAEILKKEREED